MDAESEPILSAALRANATLMQLILSSVCLWNREAFLVDALVGHPTLETIELSDTVGDSAEARTLAGAALGRLVAANTPALNDLDVSACALGDDGLRPVFAALPSKTHLSFLFATCNGISAAFAPVVLASVTANQSLMYLHVDPGQEDENEPGNEEVSIAELREAEDLVMRR